MDDIDILSSESTIQQWSDAVAAASATPAGGAVAALTSALAASLVAMVAGLTTRREKYAAVHGYAQETLERAELLRVDLIELARHDAIVVAEYMDALTLPREPNSSGPREMRLAGRPCWRPPGSSWSCWIRRQRCQRWPRRWSAPESPPPSAMPPRPASLLPRQAAVPTGVSGE